MLNVVLLLSVLTGNGWQNVIDPQPMMSVEQCTTTLNGILDEIKKDAETQGTAPVVMGACALVPADSDKKTEL